MPPKAGVRKKAQPARLVRRGSPSRRTQAEGEAETAERPTVPRLYRTRDEDGRWMWTRDELPEILASVEDDVTRQAPLVASYTQLFNEPRSLRLASLVVQSDGLKNLLHDVFADYPTVNTRVARLKFEHPFHPFVHRWDRLTAARDTLAPSTEIRQHMDELYDALYEEIEDDIARLGALQRDGYIDHDFLWAIFEPGDNVFDLGSNALNILAGNDRVSQIISTRYDRDRNFSCRARYVEYDGKEFGSVYTERQIPRAEGIFPITSLALYPLRYHPQEAAVRHRLIERGRRWEEEISSAHQQPRDNRHRRIQVCPRRHNTKGGAAHSQPVGR